MMLVISILNMLATLFMLVTIPVYVIFLITLHQNRHDELLKSPFFRLMFSLGIANLAQLLGILFGNTLASTGWVPEFYIWMGGLSARLNFCSMYGLGYAQIFAVTVVAFNRFTAYIYPMKHLKIWTDTFTMGTIIAQWAIAVLLTIPVAFVYQYNIYVEPTDNKTIYFQWTNAADNGLYSTVVTGLFATVLMVVIIVLYAIIFATAVIRKIRSQTVINKPEKSALNMAAVGFICSIGLFLFMSDLIAQIIAWNLFRYNFLDLDTNWLINNIGQSIFSSIDPYAMLLFSPTVRRRCFALACFCRGKSEGETTSTAVIPFAHR